MNSGNEMNYNPSAWQIIKSKSHIKHLAHALTLGVTGFGTCFLAFSTPEEQLFIGLASAMYILSALYAVSSIIAVFRPNPTTGLHYGVIIKIIITLLALAIGAWGVWWGGLGLFMTITGETF